MSNRVLADEEARDTVVSLSLTHGLKADLRRIARERGESMSAVPRRFLERELAAEPDNKAMEEI